MMLNIAGPGQWHFQGGFKHQLIEYKTCAFVVNERNFFADSIIGNGDIISYVSSTIDMWESNGHIGGFGSTFCKKWFPHDIVDWWVLYNAGYTPPKDDKGKDGKGGGDDRDGDHGRDSGNKADPVIGNNSTLVGSFIFINNTTRINNGTLIDGISTTFVS